MAGRITSLRFQKSHADRVNVYLDGRYALALPAVEAARLQVGEYLDDAALERLGVLDARQKAYDRAVRFLSYRPRSEAEVRRHLVQAHVDAGVIEATLARLAEQGYLDDAAFARYWVENRMQFRPRGLPVLQQELRQHGLGGAEVASALEGLDLVESAYRAARPKAQRLSALAETDRSAFRRKLGDFLLRRGFDFDVVRAVVSRLTEELSCAAESDAGDQES